MSRKNKVVVFKLILVVIVLAILISVTIHLFPVIKGIFKEDGGIAFKEKVQSSGIIGALMLFGLQFAQIFLFILPGEPIEILAGMCYGGLWGTVFIMASSCITSIIIFLLVRKYGKKFVCQFCNKEKVEKIEKSKLFQNPKKIEIIMLILFLIPGTPKDLLVYIAGLLPIKTSRFILISTFARFPSVISSTLAGANIIMRRLENGYNFIRSCVSYCRSNYIYCK